jgi:parvulin-like peptidyl-prolyl isomerase
MMQGNRWFGVAITGISGLLLTGCLSNGPEMDILSRRSLADDLSEPRSQVARAQQPEKGKVPTLERPTPATPGQLVSQPSLSQLPPAAGSPIQPASLVNRGSARVTVRAWVNTKPIFEDEVQQMAGPEMNRLRGMSEPQRSEEVAKAYNNALDLLVEQEVIYQDAMKKLEKFNPTAIAKLKGVVDQEFEKQIRKLREAGVPEDQIKETEPIARRLMERSLISMEYARNRIKGHIDSVVGLEAIRDYYDAHKNEFQTVDKVVWQDVFLAVGPKHASVADARRFAEQVLTKSSDFKELLPYDDGDSKFRGGEGLGNRRGEIRPAELEEYLFGLKEGQIGPIVEFPGGVHVFRVQKREHAGQMPLDDAVQKQIRRKMENQLAEREYKRIARELKQRAVVRIERE